MATKRERTQKLEMRSLARGKAKPASAVPEKPRRLAVYITPDLFTRTKVEAARRGSSMSAITTNALEALLADPEATLAAIPPRTDLLPPRRRRTKGAGA